MTSRAPSFASSPATLPDDPEHDVCLPHEIAGGAAAVEHDARIRQLPAQVGVSRLHHPGGVARQGAAREKDPGRLAGGGVRAAQGKGRGSAPLDVVLDALMRGQRPLAPGHQGFPGRQADPAGVEVLGANRLAEAAVMAGVGNQGVSDAPFPQETDQPFFRVGKLLHIVLEKGAVLDALGAGAG